MHFFILFYTGQPSQIEIYYGNKLLSMLFVKENDDLCQLIVTFTLSGSCSPSPLPERQQFKTRRKKGGGEGRVRFSKTEHSPEVSGNFNSTS